MHTNSTTNYSLPQFLPTDKPAWLTDVNPAYLAIDNAMKANSDAAAAAQTDATQALADAAGAAATATQADAKASGAVASLSEQFLDTNTYSVGEYVIFNNILYVCIEPVTTPGPWTGSVNWERASIDSIATNLNNAINDKNGTNIPISGTDNTPIKTVIDNLGTIYSATWSASVTQANDTRLTNSVHPLTQGKYLIIITTPNADSSVAFALKNEGWSADLAFGSASGLQSFVIPYEVPYDDMNLYIVSKQSATVHFSNLDRGSIKMIKLG